ncbi:hypothetical protein CPB86DRAFT_869765 [Serendipita vermifera]|nr:hypothetical protein CPB86DRAFT_869765 [Serendipita vermifera]
MASDTFRIAVQPCARYNHDACQMASGCPNSHIADSFSVGSGGRNVCLAYLIGRCDGWGCNYSHIREELQWSDDNVNRIVHEKMAVIYMFLGRMYQPFPYPFAPISVPIPPTDSMPLPTSPYQAPQGWSYATPATTIDENEQRQSQEECIEETLTDNVALTVAFNNAVDTPIAAVEDMQGEGMRSSVIVEPCMHQLNPQAKAFVPQGVAKPTLKEPIEMTALPTPVTSSQDLEEHQETAPDTGKEYLFNWGTSTEDDLSGWGVAKDSDNGGWGDPIPDPSTKETECAWMMEPTAGGWDAGPDESAFMTPSKGGRELPPTGNGPTSKKEKKAKKAKEPETSGKGKGKEKPLQKALKPNVSNHSAQKPSSQSSARAAFSVVAAKTKGKVVSVNEQATTSGKNASHFEAYEFPLQPGSIIPSAAKQAEILQAHAALVTKPLSSANTNSVQASKEVKGMDKETLWVNGGAASEALRPDPPRGFSERSAGSSSSGWVRSDRWPKSDKRGFEYNAPKSP